MKSNNAARITTKKQLEVLVSKLNEFTKRRPSLKEDAASAAGTVAPAATTQAPAPTPSSTQPQIPAAPVNGTSGNEVEEENTQEVDGIPTIENIIDQLNTLRAGRSLKDADVKTQVERYYAGLEDSEKEALHAYLKGIAQILSGQVDAGVAEDPKNHGVTTQSTGKRTRNIKPNVIRGTQSPKTPSTSAGVAASTVAAKSPAENTTPPAPIVPKKR
jgi:hypothetical protein